MIDGGTLMKKINLLFLLLLILWASCVKRSKVNFYENGQIGIYPQNAEIRGVKAVIWKVGPGFKQEVHKGFRVTLQFPKIALDMLKKINNIKGANGYLLRILRLNNDGQQILTYFEIPFSSPKPGAESFFHELTTTSFSLYYPDASMSLRFEKMMCPPMGTQKVLNNMKIENNNNERPGHLLLDSSEEEYITEKVHEFNFYNMAFNGGRDLAGTYQFEIAFFNTLAKKKLSSYYKIPGHVIVSGEVETPIVGCTNFQIPAKEKDKDLKDIKFGRP